MICQGCNQNPAVAERGIGPHRLHLCVQCLARPGLHHLPNWRLALPSPETRRCPTCYLGWDEFARSLRYGCPDCRLTFGPALASLLGGLRSDPGTGGERPGGGSREIQEIELSLALLIEDYELAARLRDEMDQ
jgi:protein-arginine kinase activator protein McsA